MYERQAFDTDGGWVFFGGLALGTWTVARG